jgi:hypothetical protein
MAFQYWHLLVPAALLALIVWGFRAARQATLLTLALTLLATSGFLLNTLVLDEPSLNHDLNSVMDDAALIGIPAVLGAALGALAVKQIMSRRAG